MSKRILKILLSVPVLALALISELVTILLSWSIIYDFYSNVWRKTAHLLMKTTSIASILFGLSVLILLLLTLYLLCKNRFNRNKLKLPPKKEIKKIVNLTAKLGCISAKSLVKKFGYTNTKAKYYLTLLKDAKYLKCTFKIDNSNNKNSVYDVEIDYALDTKGKEFAIKHNLD